MIRITIATAICGMALAVSAYASDPANPPKPARRNPRFTAVKTEFGHYWIEDQGQRVALFGCSKDGASGYSIGLLRQFPGQPVDEKEATDSKSLGFLGMPGLRLATSWISAPAMKGVPGEMHLDNSDPAQLIIRLSWKKSAEEFGSQVIGVAYDQDLARYVIRVEDNLQVNEPGGGEYCNFYPNGLGDLRPGVGRYDRLLFQDADEGGNLKAHYLSVIAPKPRRGLIQLPATNALVGYADEADGNPVVIVEESSPPTRDNICLCWFDSHLRWDDPFNPKTQSAPTPTIPGPPYRYYARFKAYWNSPAETKSLLAKAETVSLAPFADRFQDALPIDMNVVNDFERPADFSSGKVKHAYLQLKPVRPDGGISLDTSIGHSGQSSICFVSKSDKGMSQLLFGPELMVTPGQQVKTSAWVKTRNVTGEGFYLESGFLGGGGQIGPKHRSAALSGDHDWTLLEIPLPVTPAGTSFLGKGRITFRLSGQGTAWVDDFTFAEAPAMVVPGNSKGNE